MRPVTTAVASGSVTSLVFALAKEFLVNQVPIPPDLSQDLCSITEAFSSQSWYLDHSSFLLGLLVGLSAGPIIDLLFFLRLSWSRFLRSRWAGGSRALYRVLE